MWEGRKERCLDTLLKQNGCVKHRCAQFWRIARAKPDSTEKSQLAETKSSRYSQTRHRFISTHKPKPLGLCNHQAKPTKAESTNTSKAQVRWLWALQIWATASTSPAQNKQQAALTKEAGHPTPPISKQPIQKAKAKTNKLILKPNKRHQQSICFHQDPANEQLRSWASAHQA